MAEIFSSVIVFPHDMKIVKRNGTTQVLNTNKITYRLRKLCKDRDLGTLRNIDPDEIAVSVCSNVYDGITSSEIDVISARLAYERYTQHEEFGQLAARILVSNMHKNTHECFSEVMEILNKNVDENGERAPIIADEFLSLVMRHQNELDFIPDYRRDYAFDYFAYKVLEFGYLMRVFTEKTFNENTKQFDTKYKIVERPQHMWLRVALQIHGDDIERVKETYDYMSQKYFTHATPTLFNSGSPNPQMSSCFLIAMKEDSIDGIFSTLKDCAMISKFAGGIGLHIHNIRATGSRIRGTNGRGDGIVPMLRNFNETARYVNQGSKRKGSFAIYLSPDHADVEEFLELKLKHGDDSRRARDLFYALWIPDLFMEQVKCDGDWYLMCPDESPGLADVHSKEYEELYWKYVEQKRYRKKIKARDLYLKIAKTQAETGTPYILYKDACNRKSNQKNLGTVKSSNLCVAPETKILTDTGYHEIETLSGKNVNVWNGSEWSETTVLKTGEGQELMKITFSNGSVLECTPYHKFYIVDCDTEEKMQIEAKDLTRGARLIPYKLPIGTDLQNVAVTKVERTGRISDTYCFNEPKRHAGIFNGVLAGNCAEIVQYSSPDEISVCNLASISLPQFVDKKTFDYDKLHKVTKVVIRNLDNVIDKNLYPVPETRRSNMRHRPVGLGVQGLADVYIMLRVPFDSQEANDINYKIFETMYHAALEASCELAQERGMYETFKGSPASQGILQFDMWNHDPGNKRYNWEAMKQTIVEHGLRNSLLLACMPTASTSSILGNNEACEPITSNLYSRSVLSGNYIIMNRHLFKELNRLKLWSEDMKDLILSHGGSIQNIPAIPEKTKSLFKTAWELSPKAIINQAAARGPFICQSQSMNLFVANPSVDLVGSILKYTYEVGLKTGCYYLHSRPAANAIQFTINKDKIQKKVAELKELESSGGVKDDEAANPEPQEGDDGAVCRMEEDCIVCSA